MAEISTQLLSSSRAKVEENLIEIAKNYFGTDQINLSKSTLLGYLLNINSDTLSDNQVYNSFLFDERFINTAKFRSSVLAGAADFAYVEDKAIPCTIKAIIGIRIESFDTMGTVLELQPEEVNIKYGNIDFSLAGNVTIENIDGKWFVNQKDNKMLNVNLGILPSEVVSYGSTNSVYLTFVASLVQATITTKTEQIPVRDELLPYYIPFNALTQLYRVNVYKIVNNVKVYLEEIDSFTAVEPDLSREVFVIESGVDSTSFNIVLDTGENFKFINSGVELHIEILETGGTGGYVESPVFSVATAGTLLNRTFFAYSVVNSSEGGDKLSLLELKKDVIRHIQTPDYKTVVTEFDFVNVISKNLSVYPEDITMLIRRNDPIERNIELLSKFTDSNGELMRTNTIDVVIDTDVHGTVIDKGTILKYDSTLDAAVIIDEPAFYDPAEFYFRALMTYKVIKAPVENLLIVNTQFNNKIINVKEKYFSTNGKYLYTLRECVVTNYGDDIFKFRGRVSSNEIAAVMDNDLLEKLKIRVLMTAKTGSMQVYFDMNFNVLSQDKLFLEGDIPTNNYIDEAGRVQIKNVYFRESDADEFVYVDSYEDTVKAFFPREFDYTVYLYHTNTAIQTNTINVNDGSYNFFSLFSDTTPFHLFSVYKGLNTDNMVQDLSEVLKSRITTTDDEPNVYRMRLVSLFAREEVDNPNNTTFFTNYIKRLNTLQTYVTGIKEEPSTISLKTFNTYGVCDEYTGTTTSNIKMDIEITYQAALAKSTIFDDIRTVIVEYFADKSILKDNLKSSRNIYLSDIVVYLEHNITGLTQVRILNFTDNLYFNGALSYKDLSTKVDLDKYIPSVVNIKKNDISISVY